MQVQILPEVPGYTPVAQGTVHSAPTRGIQVRLLVGVPRRDGVVEAAQWSAKPQVQVRFLVAANTVIVQWTGHQPPKLKIEVRLLVAVPTTWPIGVTEAYLVYTQ